MATHAEWTMQVIGRIAHDLRNPLTAVQLNAQLIEQAALRGGREQEQRWASLIVSAARRLDGMLQQLAEAERIRSGRTQLAFQPVAFDQLLRETLRGASPSLDTDRIHVTLAKESLAVSADRVRLGQAVVSLLVLALQQADPAAAVTVDVGGSNGEVSCMIRAPKPPEVTAEPPLAPRARETVVAGSIQQSDGIALHVARTLIECHGGQLQVADSAECAITFRIVLPAGRG